jgi:hypothetical protein
MDSTLRRMSGSHLPWIARCNWLSAAGTPCYRSAVRGFSLCRLHLAARRWTEWFSLSEKKSWENALIDSLWLFASWRLVGFVQVLLLGLFSPQNTNVQSKVDPSFALLAIAVFLLALARTVAGFRDYELPEWFFRYTPVWFVFFWGLFISQVLNAVTASWLLLAVPGVILLTAIERRRRIVTPVLVACGLGFAFVAQPAAIIGYFIAYITGQPNDIPSGLGPAASYWGTLVLNAVFLIGASWNAFRALFFDGVLVNPFKHRFSWPKFFDSVWILAGQSIGLRHILRGVLGTYPLDWMVFGQVRTYGLWPYFCLTLALHYWVAQRIRVKTDASIHHRTEQRLW